MKLEKGLKYEIMDENGGFVRKHAHILNQREIPHHFDHSNVWKSENSGKSEWEPLSWEVSLRRAGI